MSFQNDFIFSLCLNRDVCRGQTDVVIAALVFHLTGDVTADLATDLLSKHRCVFVNRRTVLAQHPCWRMTYPPERGTGFAISWFGFENNVYLCDTL